IRCRRNSGRRKGWRKRERKVCGGSALFRLEEEIDVLERLDRVAGGDVVLVEEAVGAVARGPDARGGRTLVAGVGDDVGVFIQFYDVLGEAGVRDRTDLGEDAGDGERDVLRAVAVDEAADELVALDFLRYGARDRLHLGVGEH